MEIFYIPSAIVVGLFFSYLLTGLCHEKIKRLTDILKKTNQLENYTMIRKKRLRNFVLGIIFGFLGGIFYWIYSKEENEYYKIMNSLMILLLVPIVIYMVIPKEKYFLDTVSNLDEVKKWFNIYKCMQRKMLYGFFIFFFISLFILYLLELRK